MKMEEKARRNLCRQISSISSLGAKDKKSVERREEKIPLGTNAVKLRGGCCCCCRRRICWGWGCFFLEEDVGFRRGILINWIVVAVEKVSAF